MNNLTQNIEPVPIDLSISVIEKIKKKREIETSFTQLIAGFESKLSNFNPVANAFAIEEYFGPGSGLVTAREALLNKNIIKQEWLDNYTPKSNKDKIDFMGIYIFLNENRPFYVGISKGVIERLYQHVKGYNHFSASLAYKIGLLQEEILTGNKLGNKRNELDKEKYLEPAKKFLLKQKAAVLPICNHDELYLFEIYCSMKFQTMLNTFETH